MSGDYRDFYRGRRALVTGGLGFIGSSLCRTLAELREGLAQTLDYYARHREHYL